MVLWWQNYLNLFHLMVAVFFFFFGNHEKSSSTDEQNVLKLNKYILCSRFQLSESSCTKQLQTQS